jgi:hypothetical protein
MEFVNVVKPENPDKIINNANAPTITPNEAIIVMIFMVLFPLLANKYLLAMYNGKFNSEI